MNKVKVVKKGGASQIVIKSLKGQQVSANEVYSINTDKVDGLLRLDVIYKGKNFMLVYKTTGLITLREYLATPLTKSRFAKILKDILSNLKSLTMAYFNSQNLLLDLQSVMVNPATQSIHFVYVPVQPFENNTNLRTFLLDIVRRSSFAQGENTSYVKEYINILNSGINFSVFELEEYVKKISSGEDTSRETERCLKCGFLVMNGMKFCPNCGLEVDSSVIRTGLKQVYNPLEEMPVKKQKEEQQFKEAEELVHDGTIGSQISLKASGTPFLFQQSTGIKWGLNPVTLIGKDPYVSNITVANNVAVSREHAKIIISDNRYFIVDLNSTNKTYVNERQIQPNTQVELENNDIIKLANELFVFGIE